MKMETGATPGRARWLIGGLVLSALVVSLVLVLAARRDEQPEAQEVNRLLKELVSSNDGVRPDSSVETRLLALGPKAYPQLRRSITGQVPPMERFYLGLCGKLPRSWRRVLVRRQWAQDMVAAQRSGERAAEAVYWLGPAASRAVASSLAQALDEGRPNQFLLRSLYWSLSDSTQAVNALSQWLKNPKPDRVLFGMQEANEMWPSLPQLAPLLIPWLQVPEASDDAAEALGAMGTNAICAVPALLQLAHDTAAAPSQNDSPAPPRRARFEGQELSIVVPMVPQSRVRQQAAISALGKIGLALPEVLEVLTAAATSPNPLIRAAAADALGNLGPKALPILPWILNHLDLTNKVVLAYQLEAIGKMGPGASAAIATLEHWAEPSASESLPPAAMLGRVVRLTNPPAPLPMSAVLALCEIDRDAGAKYVDFLAKRLSAVPPERIKELRPLREPLVQKLEQDLAQTNQNNEGRALSRAFAVLLLQPDHVLARNLLMQQLRSAEPYSRASAARYLWQATGNTHDTLPVFAELLRLAPGISSLSTSFGRTSSETPDSEAQRRVKLAVNVTLSVINEMGPEAKPLVSELTPLLTHPNWSVRDRAGRALRHIAPETLPPTG